MKRMIFVAAAAVLFNGAANAQTEAPAEETPWSGVASLGYLGTTGNTETTSYNANFGIGYEEGKWKHGFTASANGSDETSRTTAEAYDAGWKSEYSFTEFDFLFGTVDWRKDRFSGIDQQFSTALGYGRRLLDTPRHVLSAGLGIGHRSIDFADGTSDSGVIGRGNLDYNWIFSETANFEQHFLIESGSENTYIESVSAVRARLISDLALVVSYTIKNNSDVPLGSEKTDTFTAISLEYAF